MQSRDRECAELRRLLRNYPVVGIVGARQVGKSTLSAILASSWSRPVERFAGIFRALRVRADRARRPARFLILGSASPELLRQSSESLAGRIAFHEFGGLALDETGTRDHTRLWRLGGLRRSYPARSERLSFDWRQEFVRTFLRRDLPQLGISSAIPR